MLYYNNTQVTNIYMYIYIPLSMSVASLDTKLFLNHDATFVLLRGFNT